jgi:mono/diheme cytochrome c family protein
MRPVWRPGAAWALALAGSLLAWDAGADEAVPRFNRDVRPILSDNCYKCHGPDKAQRKAGLRLDDRAAALEAGAFEPGDAAASELVRRISSADPDERMPPPESNLSLTPEQIATLRAWVEGGAEYEPHWSFIPVADVAVPEVADPQGWIRNPIDAFVLQRLNQEGVAPSPSADPAALLRRVTLDLTGLPPTLEELDAFLADKRPDAYERVVERLLASSAYGERMAYDWLDAARYADSYGYQNDRNSAVWPWRDWVIRAFNRNLPYDRFITYQLAGDLLPEPTQDQVLATAFNRLHRQTNEGGSIEEEFRIEYVADRTQTVATAFLGLTMECARCHDHKFDPISQEDYYRFSAFFNNIDESGLYSHFTDAIPSPSLLLYGEGQEARHIELKHAASTREAAARVTAGESGARFAAWLADPDRAVPEAKPVVHFAFEELVDNKTPDSAAPERPAELKYAPESIEGVVGKAVRFSGDSSVESKEAANFERTDPFSLTQWLRCAAHPPHTVVAHRTMAETDAGSRGYELLLRDGKPTFSLVHFWPGNAVRVQAKQPLPLDEWVHVAVTYDGSSRADGVRIYVNGQEAALEVIRDNLFKTIRYEDPNSQPSLVLGARFRDAGFKDGAIDEFRVYDRALSALEVQGIVQGDGAAGRVKALVKTRGTDPTAEALLRGYFVAAVDEPTRAARNALKASREEESAFVQTLQEIMVMRELPERRQAYVLARGAYDQRTKPVEPGTPAAALPFPEEYPRNRLGLAQWMVDRRNPLTARVAVNRYWQLFFGRGLVLTQEDFGSQGQPPSHPDLLDYLAGRFMASGWDLKGLHRLIVTSATYRQASEPRPDLMERDPENALLARGPHTRLTAELLRDNALAASGLLVAKVGGPSVKPYQPAGLWEEVGPMSYTPDTGEGLYRRSLYTFWKRTSPPPSMLTFDATNREVCVVRREVTTTPLQALVLLNDPQFVEAARVLAERAATRHPEDARERVSAVFRTLTSRAPWPEELEVLCAAYEEQRALFAAAPDAAEAYREAGEKPVNAALDPVAVAATTAVAQAVMNFEEFQFKP